MTWYEALTLIFSVVAGMFSVYNWATGRSKDFEDKLFAIKLDHYDKIMHKVFEITNALDPASTDISDFFDAVAGPFIMEDYVEDPRESIYQERISPLYRLPLELQELQDDSHIYLPDIILSIINDFIFMSNRFLVEASHYDSGLSIALYDRISKQKLLLRESIRQDLRIYHLDRRIKSRIKNIVPITTRKKQPLATGSSQG